MFNKKIDNMTAEDARTATQEAIEANEKLALGTYMSDAMQEIHNAIKLHPQNPQTIINLPRATLEVGTFIMKELQKRGFTVVDGGHYDSHNWGHYFTVSW